MRLLCRLTIILPELTVRETLDFAARVLGVGHKEGALTCYMLCPLPAFQDST